MKEVAEFGPSPSPSPSPSPTPSSSPSPSVSGTVNKHDKDPILEKKDRPPLRRRISISMQKTFTRQKTMKESDAPPAVQSETVTSSAKELSPVYDVSPDPPSDTQDSPPLFSKIL